MGIVPSGATSMVSVFGRDTALGANHALPGAPQSINHQPASVQKNCRHLLRILLSRSTPNGKYIVSTRLRNLFDTDSRRKKRRVLDSTRALGLAGSTNNDDRRMDVE